MSKSKESYSTKDMVMAKETVNSIDLDAKLEKKAKEDFNPTTFTSIDLDIAITQFYNKTKNGKAEAIVSADNLKVDLKRILKEMKSQ